MTKVILLKELKAFTSDVTGDLLLPVCPTEEDEAPPPPRPPGVYRMRLPKLRDAERKAPYILHQVITGKDIQAAGMKAPEASAVVRTVFCVYHENEEEGALALLNLMERLRIALLERVVVGNQFKLDLKAGLESLVYPEDAMQRSAPYYLGETLSVWNLPGVERKVLYGEKGNSGIRPGGSGPHGPGPRGGGQG